MHPLLTLHLPSSALSPWVHAHPPTQPTPTNQPTNPPAGPVSDSHYTTTGVPNLTQPPTCELVDPRLLGHVGKGDHALRQVAGCLVHLDEGVGAHVAAGVVGDVDGVAAGALERKDDMSADARARPVSSARTRLRVRYACVTCALRMRDSLRTL